MNERRESREKKNARARILAGPGSGPWEGGSGTVSPSRRGPSDAPRPAPCPPPRPLRRPRPSGYRSFLSPEESLQSVSTGRARAGAEIGGEAGPRARTPPKTPWKPFVPPPAPPEAGRTRLFRKCCCEHPVTTLAKRTCDHHHRHQDGGPGGEQRTWAPWSQPWRSPTALQKPHNPAPRPRQEASPPRLKWQNSERGGCSKLLEKPLNSLRPRHPPAPLPPVF